MPTFSVARALVVLAENSGVPDDDATVAARYEWGSLLEPPAVRRCSGARRWAPGSPDRSIRTASGTRTGLPDPVRAAEFSAADLPAGTVGPETLILATVRSHDQWNTTIYFDDDRYRGIKNLRTLIFMNRHDMRNRDIKEFDDADIVATARDGSTRSLHRYKAIPYDIPRGCAAGYMPEVNVLCAIGDYSTQSDQPIMKKLKVTVLRSI